MARISVAGGMTDALAQPGEPGYMEPDGPHTEHDIGPREDGGVSLPDPAPESPLLPPAPKAARAAPSLTGKKNADG